ncbi:MAG: hypothetical protein R3B35_12350 [Gemmatimonadales bacterium]
MSKQVRDSPGCECLRRAYQEVAAGEPKSWDQVADGFLAAMEEFDARVSAGMASEGDRQNGKGDFFNDLLALLLENCAGVELWSRGKVPGLMVPENSLDVTFPARGRIDFVLEAKAVGTPKHPGSTAAKPFGRPGSADLGKRIKEIGFKTIDLKAEHARRTAAIGEDTTPIGGDLTAWLRSTLPKSYVFIAARVVNDNDLKQVVKHAGYAEQYSTGVGLFAFHAARGGTLGKYRPAEVPPGMEISRVLHRACEELKAIKASRANDL